MLPLFKPGGEEHSIIMHLTLGFGSGNQKGYREDTRRRIERAIDAIRLHGVYKGPKKNFLEAWSNGVILLVLSTIGAGCFVVGRYWSDASALESSRDLQELRDSLRIVPVAATEVIPDHNTAKAETKTQKGDTEEKEAETHGHDTLSLPINSR